MSRSKQRRGSAGRRSSGSAAAGGAGAGASGGARRLPPSLTAEDLSDDRRQILAKIHRHEAIKGARGQGGNDDQSTMYDPSVYDPSVYTSHTEGVNSAHTDASGGTAGTYGSDGRGRKARRRGSNDPEGTESVASALESFMMRAPWAKGGGDNRTVASAMTYGTNRSGSTNGTGSGSFQPRLPAVAGAAAVAAAGGGGAGAPPGVTEDYALAGRARRRRTSARSFSAAGDEENQMAEEEFITLKKLRVRKFLSVVYLLLSVAAVIAFGLFMVGQKMTLYAAWPKEGIVAGVGEEAGTVTPGEAASGEGEGAETAIQPRGEAPGAEGDAGAGKVNLGGGGAPGGVTASPEENAGLSNTQTQQSGRTPTGA